MKLSHCDFSTPIARALYALELTPNRMTFWVLLAAAKAILKNPLCLTAIRGQLYAEIEDSVGISPKAIDSLIRRASKSAVTDSNYAPLRAYLPVNAIRPLSVGVFLSAWARMAADYVNDDEVKNI